MFFTMLSQPFSDRLLPVVRRIRTFHLGKWLQYHPYAAYFIFVFYFITHVNYLFYKRNKGLYPDFDAIMRSGEPEKLLKMKELELANAQSYNSLTNEMREDIKKKMAKEYDSSDLTFNVSSEFSKRVTDATYVKWDPLETKLLDFGCGTGAISLMLAPYCKNISCIDISPEMLKTLKEKLDARKDLLKCSFNIKEVNLCEVDISAISDLLGKHNVAVSVLALHHLISPDKAFAAVLATLKPGGAFFLSDFNNVNGNPHGKVDEGNLKTHGVYNRYGYSAQDMVDMLKKNGFVDVKEIDTFTLKSWVNEEKNKRFSGQTGETKTDNGTVLYEVLLGITIVAGRKPEF